jgi:site-specific DNA-methyltransferase (adenine-specific)
VSFIESEGVRVYHGDCIEVMRSLPENSVDAIVTDPPYGINFMGKAWDGAAIAAAAKKEPKDHTKTRERSASMHAGSYDLSISGNTAFQLWFTEVATEALRVLKPGGHLLAFGGTRTWHRLAVAIEDAGFEVRDSMAWLYGSGFPKSLDVSKAIDKRAGAEREVVVEDIRHRSSTAWETKTGMLAAGVQDFSITAPATPAAQQWQGWGTALKPAHEPIVVARKPLIGTVAENVLTHGTGALNIDGCRIAASDQFGGGAKATSGFVNGYENDGWQAGSPAGRWPANVILDESQATELDKQSGVTVSGVAVNRNRRPDKEKVGEIGLVVSHVGRPDFGHGDTGGASRFFYVAKAGKKERPNVDGVAHPTVKPIALMRYLVRLVTPPGGTVLEPFAGSGTTVEACILEGFDCIAIEMTDEYLPLIAERVRRSTEDKEGRLL